MTVPTFVVGTGRCGSTMLSNMLREHPKVLSLSEFFSFVSDGGRIPAAFSPEPIDGRWFWDILAACSTRKTFALRHGIAPPEILYSCGAPASRYSAETGVPAILLTTLPHLTDQPDQLFDLLREEVTGWPNAMIADHYLRLFSWLTAHFGKQLWVERSGASYLVAEQLYKLFPQAQFVHIVRDGRDAALSNREHLGFRLGLILMMVERSLGVNPFESADRSLLDRVPTEFLPFLPERFDVDAFRAYRAALPLCGWFWAQQIGNGARALQTVPSDRILTLRYEDFFVDARRQIDRLAVFLGEEFVDEAWSESCAATVRKPRSTWRDLPAEDARALDEACRPGFDLLAAQGVHYDR